MQDENKTTNLALYDTTKVGKPRDKIPVFFLLIVVLLLSNIATGAWVKQSLRQFTVQSYKLQQSQADLTERTIERDTNDTSLSPVCHTSLRENPVRKVL